MTTIGDNVARIRKQRTFTQEGLAEASGLSVETVRKLEQNVSNSPRMSTLNRLARALRIPTSALVGDASDSITRREPDDDQVALLELRRALAPARGLGIILPAGPETEAPTVADVRESLRQVDRSYHANDYAATLAALPGLLAEARAAVEASDGTDRADGYTYLAEAHRTAGKTLLQLRNVDLAYRAIDLGLDAAAHTDDEMVGASTVGTMCWLLTRQGRFEEAERLAVATADTIEPGFGPGARPEQYAEWGWLLLYAAGAAARDNRHDDAETMLDAAAAAAVRIGDRPVEERLGRAKGFGTAKVGMLRTEVAVIAGDAGQALSIAARVPADDRVVPSCYNRHRLDVAWAHTEAGQYADAQAVLLDVRRRAPAWIRHQRYARDIVETIRDARRRAMTQDMAELAELVGADV